MQQADIEIERQPPADEETPEVVAQVAEIEQTRAEMASTIDAIRDKLNPETLAQQAKDSLREATIGRAQEAVGNAVDTAKEAVSNAVDTAKEAMSGAMDTARDAVRHPARTVRDSSSSVMDAIRENPIPAALIGIGVGWMLMSAQQKNAERDRWRYTNYDPDEEYRPGYRDTGEYYSGQFESRGGSYYSGDIDDSRNRPGMVGQAREKAGELASRAKEKAGEITDRAKEKAGEITGRAKEKAGEITDRVQQRAGELGERTRYGARQAAYGIQHTVEENPVALGAVALAVGAAVGILLPETRSEHRWMGEARDNLVDRVQETGQDIAQKAKAVATEVVREAKSTAVEEAHNQGLTNTANAGSTFQENQPSTSGMASSSENNPSPAPIPPPTWTGSNTTDT